MRVRERASAQRDGKGRRRTAGGGERREREQRRAADDSGQEAQQQRELLGTDARAHVTHERVELTQAEHAERLRARVHQRSPTTRNLLVCTLATTVQAMA